MRPGSVLRSPASSSPARPRRGYGLAAALAFAGIPPALAASPALIARGQYLATAGDCAACHTAPGGQPFAGGLALKTPFGTIPTPNITPDPATGIGKMTADDFYRVMHNGIGDHGKYLYPAMPFPWYTHVTRADDDAIYAYLSSLKPVHNPDKPLDLAFPFNLRTGLVTWRAAVFRPGTFTPNPAQSAAINRGAYLVQGLGHCGACHNGNLLLGNSKSAGILVGGSIDGWYAPSLRPALGTGTGTGTATGASTWSATQLADFFAHGHAPGQGVVLGPMAQVVHESLSHLTSDDRADIAVYLKSLPPTPAAPASSLAPSLRADGANLYLSHCAFCHGQNGNGLRGQIPALAANGAVTAGGPQNVINVVLRGLPAQGQYGPMPAVGAGLSDDEIAAITNYVRTAWGNHASATAGPGAVGAARTSADTMLSDPNQRCAAITNPALSAALAPGTPAQAALDQVTTASLLPPIAAAIADVRRAAPHASQPEIVNTLTAAYCTRVAAAGLSRPDAAARLGNFAMLTWGQMPQNGGRD